MSFITLNGTPFSKEDIHETVLSQCTQLEWLQGQRVNIPYTTDIKHEELNIYLMCYMRDNVKFDTVGNQMLYKFMYESLLFLGNTTGAFGYMSDNSTLFILNRCDQRINGSMEVIRLYDDEQKKITMKPVSIDYPYVLPKRNIKTPYERFPDRLIYAVDRLINSCLSRKCKRQLFFEQVFRVHAGHICIAGGAIQKCMSRVVCDKRDTDLFIYGELSDEKVQSIVNSIWSIYNTTFKHDNMYRGNVLIRTSAAVSMTTFKSHRTYVQIVLKRYRDIPHILNSFDLDSSCLAFDGKELWASPRGKRYLLSNCNVIDVTRQSTTFTKRLLKYYRNYDVDIALPNFDASRITLNKLNTSRLNTRRHKNDLLDLLISYRNTLSRGLYKSAWISYATSYTDFFERLSKDAERTLHIPYIVRFEECNVFEYNALEHYTCDPTIFTLPSLGDSKSFFPITEDYYKGAYNITDNTTTHTLPENIERIARVIGRVIGRVTVIPVSQRSVLIIHMNTQVMDAISIDVIQSLYPDIWDYFAPLVPEWTSLIEHRQIH
jgi:hypothetical protein